MAPYQVDKHPVLYTLELCDREVFFPVVETILAGLIHVSDQIHTMWPGDEMLRLGDTSG